MTVSINDGAEVFNITLNNQDITGYSVYFQDDWNGAANANIYWKPLSEYTYAVTLSSKKFKAFEALNAFPNPVADTFTLNQNIERLEIYAITGKLYKTITGGFKAGYAFDISELNQGIYLAKATNDSNEVSTIKLIKN
jgi:hypothetical protein